MSQQTRPDETSCLHLMLVCCLLRLDQRHSRVLATFSLGARHQEDAKGRMLRCFHAFTCSETIRLPTCVAITFEQNEVSFFCTALKCFRKNKQVLLCVCVYMCIFLIFICFSKKKQLLTSCCSSAASGDKNHSVVSEADLCSLNRFTSTLST